MQTDRHVFGPSLRQLFLSSQALNRQVKFKLSRLKPEDRLEFAHYCDKEVEYIRNELRNFEESAEKWQVKELLHEIISISNSVYRTLFPL